MPQLGDVGISIQLTVTKESDGSALDISAATTRQIKMKPVDGSALLITATALLVTDGKDGKMQCITQAGHLNVIGVWEAQGYIEIGALQIHTSITEFTIERILT